MFVAALHVTLDAAGIAAGIAAARRSSRLAAGLGLAALAVVLAKCYLASRPGLEPSVFPWDFYPFVERWWFYPPVFFLLGAALYAARASTVRRDLLLVFAGLLVLRASDIAVADAFPPSGLKGRVSETGYCRQTTGYSCGAAAAAMFVNLYGIETCEDEMARLCVTRSGLGGTTEAGVLRGLRQKNLHARILHDADFEDPCMAVIRINGLVNHWVVVVGHSGYRVLIADPSAGIYWMDKERFRKLWLGLRIEARRAW